MRPRVPLAAIVCFLITWTTLQAGGSDREILNEVRRSHQASIQSIHSFSCRYSVRNSQGTETERGEYWRKEDQVRVRQTLLGGQLQRTSDIFILESQRIWLSNAEQMGNQRQPNGTIAARTDRTLDKVWELALLIFAGPKYERWTFDELLTKSCRLRSAKRVTEAGHQYCYIDLTHENGRLEFWFDPGVNYLVRKVVIHEPPQIGSKEKARHWQGTVMRFKEVIPGTFFPELVAGEVVVDGRTIHADQRTFTDIRINEQFPKDIFTVRYVPGMEIADSTQGKTLRADANGRLRVVPGKDLSLTQPAPLGAPGEQYPTTDEPRSLTRWILPVSVAVLAVAGIAWLVRRKRQLAESVD